MWLGPPKPTLVPVEESMSKRLALFKAVVCITDITHSAERLVELSDEIPSDPILHLLLHLFVRALCGLLRSPYTTQLLGVLEISAGSLGDVPDLEDMPAAVVLLAAEEHRSS